MRVFAKLKKGDGLGVSLAVCCSLMCYPVSLLLFDNWVLAGMMSAFCSAIAMHHWAACLAGLQKRVETGASPAWDVTMNHVAVGTMSDAEYARIRIRALNDPRCYLAQVFNLLKGVLRSLSAIMWVTPLVTFWGALAIISWAPDVARDILSSIQTVGFLRAVEQGLALYEPVGIAAMLMTLVGTITLDPAAVGIEDKFDVAVAIAIRKRLGISAEGRLTMTQQMAQPAPTASTTA